MYRQLKEVLQMWDNTYSQERILDKKLAKVNILFQTQSPGLQRDIFVKEVHIWWLSFNMSDAKENKFPLNSVTTIHML